MKRTCRCGMEIDFSRINGRKWYRCPNCGALIHLKFSSKNGRLKKLSYPQQDFDDFNFFHQTRE